MRRYDIFKSSVLKQRQKDDEEGQLQRGISTINDDVRMMYKITLYMSRLRYMLS